MRDHILIYFSVALVLAATTAFAAAPSRSELKAAEELLAAGSVEEALQQYQNLQVDYPEAPEAVLGTGCAHYRKAEMELAAGQLEEARASFSAAQDSFQRLFSNEAQEVRSSAMFDYGNALAKTAKSYDTEKEYQQQVNALRQAIGAYEQLLEAFPDHAGGQTNIDHVRFVLKKLLQSPPGNEKQPPMVFQLEATTELPNKEAVVNENEIVLQEKGPGGPAQPGAPSQAPASGTGEEVSI